MQPHPKTRTELVSLPHSSAPFCTQSCLCVYLLKPDPLPWLSPRRTNPGMTVLPVWHRPNPQPTLLNSHGCLWLNPNARGCQDRNGPVVALLAAELLGGTSGGLCSFPHAVVTASLPCHPFTHTSSLTGTGHSCGSGRERGNHSASCSSSFCPLLSVLS